MSIIMVGVEKAINGYIVDVTIKPQGTRKTYISQTKEELLQQINHALIDLDID